MLLRSDTTGTKKSSKPQRTHILSIWFLLIENLYYSYSNDPTLTQDRFEIIERQNSQNIMFRNKTIVL